MTENTCPLCLETGELFYQQKKQTFLLCPQCKGIFVPTPLRPAPSEEKERYLKHHNDISDPGYQAFVSPMVEAICRDFSPEHKGLDFGAGTGPVISAMLAEKNYQTQLYDPFFHPNDAFLQQEWDYIICCEVMEHFYHPRESFALLFRLLKKGSKLFCMTGIYHAGKNFNHWHYKNDITHVFIYQQDTLQWIQQHWGFSKLTVEENLILFEK